MKSLTKSLPFVLSAVILLITLLGCSRSTTPEPALSPSDDPTQSSLSSLAQIRNRGVLIVGTAITKPFVFHDPATDALIGFDLDLAGQIADHLGVTMTVVEMNFANLIPALQDHKVDMIIAAMHITVDREKLVDFSQPYLDSGLVMVALPGQQMQIKTVQDLAGRRVGVKIGATGAKIAQELAAQGINLEIVEYKNTDTSLLDLEVGRVDVIFNDYLNTLAYIKDNRSNIQIVTDQAGEINYLSQVGLGIATQQNTPELLGLINATLKDMEQDGTLDTLYKFWFLPTVEG